MRLLHTKKLELQEFGGKEVPCYAILSHTWGKEEVTLQDIKTNEAVNLQGYKKISKACSMAATNGFEYIWIDTCCIDKTSSAELSEALNSMYRWYQEAEECYAYLADVSQNSVNRVTGVTDPEFRESKWFTRGWTLQELIAPLSVVFLDKQWQEIGTKSDLQRDISEITGIPGGFLLGDDLRNASVAQRMSWASKRETTRTEDLAYCLMGLFGIYMPMLYGEGERAFIRLQEEIIRVSDDHSLFAWRSIEDHGGILANSPAAFVDSGNIIPVNRAYTTGSPSTLSSRGIHLSLRFVSNGQQGQGLAILHCTEIGKERMRLALHLRDIFQTNEDFVREQSTKLLPINLEDMNLSQYPLTSLYIRQWHPMRNRNWEDMEKCVVKLAGVDGQEVTSRIANFDSNCELSDGLMIMNIASIPDGIFGRLLIVCKDGIFFLILLKKYGKSVSADISINVESHLQDIQGHIIPGREQSDQDRIVKVLSDGQHVDIAIKKRVLLLQKRRCLTEVVEISYSSTLKEVWLEHISILEKVRNKKELLSYAALRGLITIVEHLLDGDSIESNSKDDLRTPLSWAAEGGQEAVVKHLLKKGATPESKDKNGRIPLSWAAGTGHAAIVQLLLTKAAVLKENEQEIQERKPLSLTALQWLLAAKGNKVGFKKNENQLRYYQLESRDDFGLTPLSYAAENGHETVVKLLLDKGAELETKSNSSQTPLSYAAENGHETVVKLLVDKGAELETKSRSSWTPLSYATKNGHETVVKLLLDKGAELETKSNSSQTPLSYAAENGHETVVKLLLDKGAELETKSRLGWTPLLHAAKNGHETVVKLLLDKGAELEITSSSSWTPLLYAAKNGHKTVVKLLLDKGAELETKSNSSQTSLSYAAENGHEIVVKLLLDKGAELEIKSSSSWTPLLHAAKNGHETVVKLLLDKGAELETKSNFSQTPLSYAAENGHENIVKLLFDKDAKLEAKDIFDQTPLLHTAKNGHETIVKLLLDKGAELETKSNSGQTPLSYAAEYGHETVVKLLLDKGAELETKSKSGQTPLSYAAENGHETVVKLLLDKGAELETKSRSGWTPLSYAAENGHKTVVKLLLDKGAKLETKSRLGWKPLLYVAENGHETVVKLLLDKADELETKNRLGWIPLLYAAENGHETVVKLLLDKGAELETKSRSG